MTATLQERIASHRVPPGSVTLFYLGQAGFLIKDSAGTVGGLDPYLSDVLENESGAYKRLIPTVMKPEEFYADLLIATHAHGDHLDTGLLRVAAANNPQLRFLGSPDCREICRNAGFADDCMTILACGEAAELCHWQFRAVHADHGALAPDAIGLLLEIGEVRLYFTGDTSVCPERIVESLGKVPVDLMVVPVNPAYGNPGAKGAAELVRAVAPRIAVASHFGMFVEHGGVPGDFLAELGDGGRTKAVVLAPAESLTLGQNGVFVTETAAAFQRRTSTETTNGFFRKTSKI
ncbi:MAG: MBL fold metallo-hydrolase [Victivallaceae bacterium]|nr:MBL fold metallo-hydrolase [Victivallaceae bacterium]